MRCRGNISQDLRVHGEDATNRRPGASTPWEKKSKYEIGLAVLNEKPRGRGVEESKDQPEHSPRRYESEDQPLNRVNPGTAAHG